MKSILYLTYLFKITMNEDQFNQYYELLKNTFDKRYEFD